MIINVNNDEMLGRAVEKELYFELYNRLKEKDKEIERLNLIIKVKTKRIQQLMGRLDKRQKKIKEVREYIVSQKLHKIVDTTGGLTYEERKLLEILDKERESE